MEREGIEKLFNITDRSYNVLNYIDFTYFTYNTCSVNNLHIERKLKLDMYISAGWRDKELSLSLFLSLSHKSSNF